MSSPIHYAESTQCYHQGSGPDVPRSLAPNTILLAEGVVVNLWDEAHFCGQGVVSNRGTVDVCIGGSCLGSHFFDLIQE
jgi:hypothetical protein